MKSKAMLVKAKDVPIKDGYHVNDFVYIEGACGFIVTASDLVHQISRTDLDRGEVVDLTAWEDGKKNPDGSKTYCMTPQGSITVSLDDIEELPATEIDLIGWVHYFGIKPRIRDNYKLLQDSCRNIDAEVDFPQWESRRLRKTTSNA